MIWLVTSIVLWGIIHSILASRRAKSLAVKVFGPWGAKSYRLAYNVISIATLLPVLALGILLPDTKLYSLRFPLSALFIMLELISAAGLMMAFAQTNVWEFIGLSQLEGSSPPGKLITTGFYRFVRHPQYSFGLAVLWFFPYMTLHLITINTALTIYILIGTYFEERKLIQEFGQQFRDYSRVTPMFIPLLKRRQPRE